MIVNTSVKKEQPFFNCILCDYKTCHKGHWKSHLSTDKHKVRCIAYFNTKMSKIRTTGNKTHICYCGKQYSHSQSLWRHKQSCKLVNEIKNTIGDGVDINSLKNQLQDDDNENQEESDENTQFSNNLIDKVDEENKSTTAHILVDKKTLHLMEENSKLKDDLINMLNDKNVTISSIVANGDNNVINATHNTVNINVFLDQNYSDAMNFNDFVKNIECTLTDLRMTADEGYVKGVSKIFMKNLEILDPKARPIHCGDYKGTQIYIRDSNKWERDGGKLDIEIDNVAKKQITLISQWEKEHPEWYKNESLTHEYLNMVRTLTSTDIADGKDQIKKNVAKNVVLEELVAKSQGK